MTCAYENCIEPATTLAYAERNIRTLPVTVMNTPLL